MQDIVAGSPGAISGRWELLRCVFTYLRDWRHTTAIRPYWRIYWNSECGAVVRQGGVDYGVDPDAIVLIPPATPVEQRLHNPVHTFFIHVRCGWPYDRLAGRVFRLPLTVEAVTCIERLARKRSQKWDGPLTPGEEMAAYAIVTSALARIPDDLWPLPVKEGRVLAAQAAIDACPEKPHPNPALAALAHMSPNAFIRLFRTHTGMPPQAYVIMRRLEKACILLEHSGKSIDAIAEACGFCDRNYFTRMFRSKNGSGPATYRRQRLSGGRTG